MASIRAKTGVRIHVLIAMRYLLESLVAKSTFERMFAGVNTAMRGAFAASRERDTAIFTLEWFFTSVSPGVTFQKLFRPECLLTVITMKWSLRGFRTMRDLVFDEIALPVKCTTASRTQVRCLFSMYAVDMT